MCVWDLIPGGSQIIREDPSVPYELLTQTFTYNTQPKVYRHLPICACWMFHFKTLALISPRAAITDLTPIERPFDRCWNIAGGICTEQLMLELALCSNLFSRCSIRFRLTSTKSINSMKKNRYGLTIHPTGFHKLKSHTFLELVRNSLVPLVIWCMSFWPMWVFLVFSWLTSLTWKLSY